MIARRRLAPAVLLLAAPGLASCSVNFHEQTDMNYNVAVGVSDRSGQVDVLNALVVSGRRGSGTVVTTLVNNDQARPDKLVRIAGAGADSSVTVTLAGPTDIPAGGLLNLAAKGRDFASGARIDPGRDVTLTFTFQRAKAITVQMPVVGDFKDYRGIPLPPGASPSGTPSSAPSTAPSQGASPGVSTSPSP